MKRHLQMILALSFALLQCVAPLAHAHISGSSAGQGIHLPELQQDYEPLEFTCCSAETNESPSVGISQGFERDDEPSSSGSQMVFTHPAQQNAVASASPVFQVHQQQSVLPHPAYSKPFSQAPPALG